MPRFEKNNKSLELKIFLKTILSDNNVGKVLDNIVNNKGDELWDYVVGYKLVAHNLERLKIDDPELAFLVGRFLGNYHAIESLHKKYDEKRISNEKIEKYISSEVIAVDVLSDLYVTPAVSTKTLTTKYKDENIYEVLDGMTKERIIYLLELEKESYYVLPEESREYMKEKYFYTVEEEKKEKKESDNIRSRVLHIVREKNKEEME